MRIAIVNDLSLAVEALRRAVRSIPGAEVAWVAHNGAEAIDCCGRDRPDLILMDLVMPVVDGVEATQKIMRRSPCPVLIVTASVHGNVAKVYEALGHGALDAVATPRLSLRGDLEGAAELIRKIATVDALTARPVRPPLAAERPPAASADANGAARLGVVPLVAIGASTGGPRALAEVLGSLPADLPATVAVVQHIDAAFAQGLAQWLTRQTGRAVEPLSEPMPLRPGQVWLAAGPGHLVLRDDRVLALATEPEGCLHCPSIDVFFASVAARLRRGCGVLLTGMGSDGASGLLALRRAGFHTIAQDEHTSIVWGMPRVAAENGGAVEVLPIEQIAARVVAHVTSIAANR